jgi:hypothetical protein
MTRCAVRGHRGAMSLPTLNAQRQTLNSEEDWDAAIRSTHERMMLGPLQQIEDHQSADRQANQGTQVVPEQSIERIADEIYS